jgi:hypothetical protein
MELASMLAGERFSDRPASVCPIVGALLRAHNDTVDDERRGDLYRYAAEAVGTRGDFELQLTRAAIAIEWAERRYDQRRRTLKGKLRSTPEAPAADHGPDQIARYVIRSLSRDQAGHERALELIDDLIATAPAPIEAVLDVLELFEQERETVQHGGRSEELVLAELA